MKFPFRRYVGVVPLIAAVLVPGLVASALMHSVAWVVFAVPLGIVLLFLVASLLPLKRWKMTPDQFADALERHLQGTEGHWDWDDLTTFPIEDERIQRIQGCLIRFDSLALEEDKEELRQIIAALRRGEFPEVRKE